jgi:hypothetical protein
MKSILSIYIALAATLVAPPLSASGTTKQSVSPVPPAAPPVTQPVGPKVHTSKADDVSGCSTKVNSAVGGAAGLAAATATYKLGGGGGAIMMANEAGAAAAMEAEKSGRCSAKAEKGDGPSEAAPKRKKIKLPNFGF